MALVEEMPQTLDEAQRLVAYLATLSVSVMSANGYTEEDVIATVYAFDDIWEANESELLGAFGLKPAN